MGMLFIAYGLFISCAVKPFSCHWVNFLQKMETRRSSLAGVRQVHVWVFLGNQTLVYVLRLQLCLMIIPDLSLYCVKVFKREAGMPASFQWEQKIIGTRGLMVYESTNYLEIRHSMFNRLYHLTIFHQTYLYFNSGSMYYSTIMGSLIRTIL